MAKINLVNTICSRHLGEGIENQWMGLGESDIIENKPPNEKQCFLSIGLGAIYMKHKIIRDYLCKLLL